nr:hypothetical protein [Pedobacter panaciterrae]
MGKSLVGKLDSAYLSKKEIKSRLEKFIGAKFDEDNLLPVNWIEGEFLVMNLNVTDFKPALKEKQRGMELKRFKFLFEKGGNLKSKQEFELKQKDN